MDSHGRNQSIPYKKEIVELYKGSNFYYKMNILRKLLIWVVVGWLIVNVHAGFIQLTDRESATSLDGSTTDGAGYIALKGDSTEFSGHALGSESYTITLWIQETANTPGTEYTIMKL